MTARKAPKELLLGSLTCRWNIAQARFKQLDLLFDRTRYRDHRVGPLPDRVVEIGDAEVRPYFAAATIQAGRREFSAKRRGRLIWRRSARIDKVAAISLLPELVGGAAEFFEYSSASARSSSQLKHSARNPCGYDLSRSWVLQRETTKGHGHEKAL
ncbi:hypothetical protein [Bradyrhizobium sp. 141]|uniref:hypothetical protein n=1 Tax=Bradyrhizobium sp. 141 TaxID=2782617 RepID=UPI001FFB8CAD|nr:hypothetical protein [Bradyrhizobium sp. 141]MCK1718210.1 hypothetical protein [Bradyrhizobium sp. 141]